MNGNSGEEANNVFFELFVRKYREFPRIFIERRLWGICSFAFHGFYQSFSESFGRTVWGFIISRFKLKKEKSWNEKWIPPTVLIRSRTLVRAGQWNGKYHREIKSSLKFNLNFSFWRSTYTRTINIIQFYVPIEKFQQLWSSCKCHEMHCISLILEKE